MQILEGRLYIASAAQASNWELLSELNVTHIVNACRCENPFATWISYYSCDLADTATEDLVRACVPKP